MSEQVASRWPNSFRFDRAGLVMQPISIYPGGQPELAAELRGSIMSVAALENGCSCGKLHGVHFASFHECYPTVLDTVYRRAEYENAPRNYRSREVVGTSYSITQPWRRFYVSPVRRANLVFNYAEALWYLAGSDDLAYLRYYAPSITRFTGTAQVLQGTAYGPRIFSYGAEAVNQWRRVCDTLWQDQDSKRGIIQIFSPGEALDLSNDDVACTLSFQFMLRNGALEAIAFMRANDAYRGMVSDVFSFTLLQEVLAAELNVPMGRYHHHVGSLHVYERDYARVERMLAAPALPAEEFMFPLLPRSTDVWRDLAVVHTWESRLRANTHRLDERSLELLDLPPYWQGVVGLFECYRRIRRNEPQSDRLVMSLPAVFRVALAHRWPSHFAVVKEDTVDA